MCYCVPMCHSEREQCATVRKILTFREMAFLAKFLLPARLHPSVANDTAFTPDPLLFGKIVHLLSTNWVTGLDITEI